MNMIDQEECMYYEFTYYNTNDEYKHDLYELKESELQSKINELEANNCTHITIFDGNNDTIVYDDGEFF